MRRSGPIVAFLVSVGALSVVAAAHAQPAIQLEDTAVVATGITPGGKVAWLAVARERVDWTRRVMLWQDADAVADGNGKAVLDLGRDVPVKSIWIVIDMTTGAFAAFSPPAYPWATQVPFPTASATWASDGVTLLSLRDDREELEVLVVRPKVGAWRATIRHDDPSSRDVGGVLLTPASLVPWGSTPASPGNLGPGDVIVAIDPDRMQYFAQQLGGRP